MFDFSWLFRILAVLALIGLTLGVWKLVEIIIWIVQHVHIG
jgi:uncharacterized membrane protein